MTELRVSRVRWALLASLFALLPQPTAAERPSAAALAAARAFLCPHGGAPVRVGLRGRGRCRVAPGRGGPGGGGWVGGADDAAGWDAGLRPSGGTQRPCPPGTLAAAAVARTDATRCVPE